MLLLRECVPDGNYVENHPARPGRTERLTAWQKGFPARAAPPPTKDRLRTDEVALFERVWGNRLKILDRSHLS